MNSASKPRPSRPCGTCRCSFRELCRRCWSIRRRRGLEHPVIFGKARGDVFIDQLEARFGERGIAVRRYAKPTNTKVAPIELAQTIAEECDVVVEALSD